MLGALSAGDARAQSNSWSLSFDLGTQVALTGDVHGGGSGTVLSLPTQVEARSYKDAYGNGVAVVVPMVWGDYWIIGLAPDYSWAVVGDPGRDHLWILARAPYLDDASTAVAQAVARDNGFNIDLLVPTSQAGAGRP